MVIVPLFLRSVASSGFVILLNLETEVKIMTVYAA